MMKKYLLIVGISLLNVGFGVFRMDGSAAGFDNIQEKTFWVQLKDNKNISIGLSPAVAASMERIRDKTNNNKNKISYDCTERELQIFKGYVEGRDEVKNGIAEKGAGVIRNVDVLDRKHQEFLLNLNSRELAKLSIMTNYFYKEILSSDLVDPWVKCIATNLDQGIGKGNFFDSLFVGHEEQADRIFDFCSTASGVNERLNASNLKKSAIVQPQTLKDSDKVCGQDPSILRKDQSEIKSTLLTRFATYFAPYKSYIPITFGACMVAGLVAIAALQYKISSLR